MITIIINKNNTTTHLLDISNLRIENKSEEYKIISFEDAVRLYSKLSNTIDSISEDKLRNIENNITLDGYSNIKYYQFIGEFMFMEIEELQGLMTTLIIVAKEPETHICIVLNPLTEVSCAQSNINWVQMDSSAIISDNNVSARLSSMGYIELLEDDTTDYNRLSNTTYPTFTLSRDKIL